MDFLYPLILLLLVAAFGWLFYQFRRQSQRLEEARANLAELSVGESPEREPEMMLTLRVVDPLALAKRESRSARMLADTLPVMVRRMVYQQVMKEIEEELRERDIDVDMRLEYR
ncbi:MAG: hypothetical protein R3280_07080 [Marinobacter sp.]|uniref:hypothetical protein n=1 Tax=Marinobacter sp. TaxID=50741 RepID=UPI00299ED00D|nr:hypothetical protein [Marinobacter sp.]MDX1634379.1 hypothetical protein [Marinobacter sp.]